MPYETTKISYSGKIKQVTLGSSGKAVTVGGEDSYPFHLFEGKMPNRPRIAMEVWDMEPEDWAEAAVEPFKDVIKNPAAWAKKCVEEYGADLIVLQLKSTDPNGLDKGPAEASAVVKKVVEAVDVPIIVWGVANTEKDAEVLKKIAEDCEGKHLALGPVEEGNHKQIGAAALGYKHTVISSSPIDVNLAKQVNILLENLGVKDDLLIDPTTGGLGYGLEYSYSVMERLRMAALVQEDDKLQYPMVCNVGNEVWKSKEAKLSAQEAPNMGDPMKRGYLMEAVAAVSYLLAGGDVLFLRHPESVKLVKNFIGLMSEGGAAFTADSMTGRQAQIKEMPTPLGIDVAFERKKVEVAPKKVAAKPAAPKEAPKVEKKAEPKVEKKPEAPKVEKAAAAPAPEVKAEDAAKAAAEKAAAEKAAAEKAAKEAAEKAAAKEKAEKEAAEKAAAEKAAAKAKEKEKEDARKAARLAEKEKRMAAAHRHAEVTLTPAEIQLTRTQKLIQRIDRVHKRDIA